MKKLFIIAAFLLAPFSAFAAFDTNLTYGSHGDSVTELQEFLTAQGVYSGPVTGNFYTLTLQGVKTFQRREGITPISGYFGPITRGVASNILSIPDGEQDASTTTPPVDYSTTTPSVSSIPQVIYIQVPVPTNNQNSMNNTPTINTQNQQQAQTAPTPAPFNVYQLQHEKDSDREIDDFYYAGSLELKGATIDGVDATFILNKYLSPKNACIYPWVNGERQEKVCGYYVARFTGAYSANSDIVLTSTDSQNHSESVPTTN